MWTKRITRYGLNVLDDPALRRIVSVLMVTEEASSESAQHQLQCAVRSCRPAPRGFRAKIESVKDRLGLGVSRRQAIRALSERWHDLSLSTRRIISVTLPDELMRAAIELAKNESPADRIVAGQVFCELRSSRGTQGLSDLVRDTNEEVRRTAARALKEIAGLIATPGPSGSLVGRTSSQSGTAHGEQSEELFQSIDRCLADLSDRIEELPDRSILAAAIPMLGRPGPALSRILNEPDHPVHSIWRSMIRKGMSGADGAELIRLLSVAPVAPACLDALTVAVGRPPVARFSEPCRASRPSSRICSREEMLGAIRSSHLLLALTRRRRLVHGRLAAFAQAVIDTVLEDQPPNERSVERASRPSVSTARSSGSFSSVGQASTPAFAQGSADTSKQAESEAVGAAEEARGSTDLARLADLCGVFGGKLGGPHLEKWLTTADVGARAGLVWRLARRSRPSDRTAGALRDLACDPNPVIARSALLAVVDDEDDAGERLVMRLLRSPHENCRRIAAARLRSIPRCGAGGPSRLHRAEVEGRGSRMSGSHAVFTPPADSMRFDDGIEVLVALTRDRASALSRIRDRIRTGDPDERIHAIRLAVRARVAAACELEILAALAGHDVRVASSAVLALAHVETESALAALRACLDHTDARVRANALEALSGRLRRGAGDASRPRAAEDGSPAPKRDAHHALTWSDSGSALPSQINLAPAIESDAARERCNAAHALIQAAEPKLRDHGLAVLASMLDDDRPSHRRSALWLTARLGWTAPAHRVAVIAREDLDFSVRVLAHKTARRLLAELRTETPSSVVAAAYA